MFEKINYDSMHHIQVGQIGEYWTKLTLSLFQLDVYTTEVDNKGIDFIARVSSQKHIDIQVKTIRTAKTSYVFIPKEKEWATENLRPTLYLALVLLENYQMPKLYLIPSTAWLANTSPILKDRNYGEDKKSKPEWGINISEKNLKLLEEFEPGRQVGLIKS